MDTMAEFFFIIFETKLPEYFPKASDFWERANQNSTAMFLNPITSD